jgi:hypothetical protein
VPEKVPAELATVCDPLPKTGVMLLSEGASFAKETVALPGGFMPGAPATTVISPFAAVTIATLAPYKSSTAPFASGSEDCVHAPVAQAKSKTPSPGLSVLALLFCAPTAIRVGPIGLPNPTATRMPKFSF